MPIHRIEVQEYECIHCGYKWVNRVNGKDGPVPKKCAKCKRMNWDTGYNESRIGPKESGLRRRVKNLYHLYHVRVWRVMSPLPLDDDWNVDDYLDRKVITEFLGLEPRPTAKELIEVLFPEGLNFRGITSQNWIRHEGWYPHPEKPGYLKRDRYPFKEYLKTLKSDGQKQQQLMQQVIDSRKDRTKANPALVVP